MAGFDGVLAVADLDLAGGKGDGAKTHGEALGNAGVLCLRTATRSGRRQVETQAGHATELFPVLAKPAVGTIDFSAALTLYQSGHDFTVELPGQCQIRVEYLFAL